MKLSRLILSVFVLTVSCLAGEDEVDVCHWFCIHCFAEHVQFHVSHFIIMYLTNNATVLIVVHFMRSFCYLYCFTIFTPGDRSVGGTV